MTDLPMERVREIAGGILASDNEAHTLAQMVLALTERVVGDDSPPCAEVYGGDQLARMWREKTMLRPLPGEAADA